MSHKALITGITGQDGSYLAEFLLEKGYEVHGITRRSSISNTARIDHLIEAGSITLHDGDLSDSSSLIRIISEVQPDEIYNLAAQSHVQVSFDAPEYSGDVDALGVLRILEAVRICGLAKKTKVYQASTSELFGKVEGRRPSFSARSRKCRREKRRRSIRTALTQLPSSTVSGWSRSTEKPMVCSR